MTTMNMEGFFAARNSRLPTSRSEDFSSQSSINGLPRQFVNSMRTLFNILDDAGVGLVPLTEIERRWRDDAVPNLPGVLDCLRTVAPADGLLSFEIFVWGLRTALARARQCRERNMVDANNRKNATSRTAGAESDGEVLPPYYYQRKAPPTKGKPLLPSKVENMFKQNGRSGPSVTEGLRSESYAPCTTTCFPDDMIKGRYQVHGSQQQQYQSFGGNDQSQQPIQSNRPSSRGFKPGHRRSNSGPITTAKVLPSPKRNQWPGDMGSREEGKVTKMGYATKFAAEPVKANSSDKENDDVEKPKPCDVTDDPDVIKCDSSGDKSSLSMKSEPAPDKDGFEQMDSSSQSNDQSSQVSERSDLDRLTANTLFISTDNQTSLNKPIGLSGKYIGITGTLQRAKSAAAIPNQHYGSLRRPAMSSKPSVSSASESSFNGASREFDLHRLRNSVRAHKKQSPPPNLAQQYASAGESGDDSHNHRLLRDNRTSPSKPNAERASSDGAGRRCNSASPPDRPAYKAPRSSTSPSLDDKAYGEVGGHVRRPKSTSPDSQEERRKEQMQPATWKSAARAAVFQASSELTQTNGTEGSYATLGRRRTSASKRRDPRRHTVANGIDYSVLKCMKLLEQEKDLVLQGVDALDRGREWFQVRLCDVQERQRQMTATDAAPSRSGALETDAEVTQSRLDHLLTKISELTKLVKEISDPGFKAKDSSPRHSPTENSAVLSALREQNHVLTREVARQSEKITQLEHEKSVLVQQLFQAKAEAQCVDGQVNTSIFI